MRTRNLLLSSAAGLMSITAAHAADLPVKAKPVEYVKVCSLYGAGFYYMPGTDMCLKVGGYVRAQVGWGYNGSFSSVPFSGYLNNRTTSNLTFRARGYITADAREQTAYGTVRAYIAVGTNMNDVGLNNAANTFSSNRAFLQFAGLTAGISQSFYDYYSNAAMSYNGLTGSDTGDPGWFVLGYTAQLGNGLSATLSMEQRRTTQIIDSTSLSSAVGTFSVATGGSILAGGYPTTISGVSANNGAYGGLQVGDIVGNLRLDQAWGGAQIMGALHQDNGTYYSTVLSGAPTGTFFGTGHPGDAWGWAVGAGLRLNFPMIGEGDYLQAQANYTQGATRYMFFGDNQNFGEVNSGKIAYGVQSDCVYGGTVVTGTTTNCQLTTAYGFNAGYEHHWSPAWQTSLYGGWDAVRYNTSANNQLCSAAGFGTGIGTAAVATAGCNNNWDTWFVGSRTQWNVTKTFYMGVDVMYAGLDSAKTGSTGSPLGYGGCVTGSACSIANVTGSQSSASIWTFQFRAHKDFLP